MAAGTTGEIEYATIGIVPDRLLDKVDHLFRLAFVAMLIDDAVIRVAKPVLIPCHTDVRPSSARASVASSAYSRSLPIGMPRAMRVTRSTNGESSFAR